MVVRALSQPLAEHSLAIAVNAYGWLVGPDAFAGPAALLVPQIADLAVACAAVAVSVHWMADQVGVTVSVAQVDTV